MNVRIRLLNLVGRQFCPTVLACGDGHAHNRTPTSTRTTFAQLILSKTVMYLTNRFHVAVRLFSNRSQMTSKSKSKSKSVNNLGYYINSIPHFVFFEAIAILGLFMLEVC